MPTLLLREKLESDRTYYVRTDGNDANTGLDDSPGGALLKIQRALDIICDTLDVPQGVTVTVQIGNGVFPGSFGRTAPHVGGGAIVIQGNASSPASVILQGDSASQGVAHASGGFRMTVRGVEMTNAHSALFYARWGGQIDFENVRCASAVGGHILVSFDGVVRAIGNYTIVGGGAYHFHAHNGAIRCQGVTAPVVGTPHFTQQFANANSGGSVLINGSSFPGAATGRKYFAETGGQIFTGAISGGVAPLDDLPGSLPGVLATGGVYNQRLSSATRRNIIYAGNLTTNPWQRGTIFTGAANGTWLADGFRYGSSGTPGVVTVAKSSDAPTIGQAGFCTRHSLYVEATAANASIDADDLAFVAARPIGADIAHLGFGQPGARSITVSFLVKSAKAGIHCLSMRNGNSDRVYVAEYLVLAPNTWERKLVTIPGDEIGTWFYGADELGASIAFVLACGSTFQTTAGSWQAANAYATPNQVNVLDRAGNGFKVALVQIEAGDYASEYEALSEAEVLARSRRYLFVGNVYVPATTAQNLRSLDMAAVPTISGGGPGFTSAGTTKDSLVAFQTTGAVQTLTLTCER